MSFRSVSTGEPGRLSLCGSLTIENAAVIRQLLLGAFRESDRITLEIGEDAVADASFLQILCSAYRTAFIGRKTFEVDWSSAPEIRLLFAGAGYDADAQCSARADEDRIADRGGQNG